MSCCATDAEIEVGTAIRLDVAITTAGAPIDAAAVILRVKDPAGVVTTPPTTHDGTGAYHAVVTVDSAGQWFYRWESTGPTSAQEGSFVVRRSQVI